MESSLRQAYLLCYHLFVEREDITLTSHKEQKDISQASLLSNLEVLFTSLNVSAGSLLKSTLHGMVFAFKMLVDPEDHISMKKAFQAVSLQADEAFELSFQFEDKLLATKLRIFSTLILHDYYAFHINGKFNRDRNHFMVIGERLSNIFKELLSIPEVKTAVSEEYEIRNLTTSIWMSVNHQAHSTLGQAILGAIASLQDVLESLFPQESFSEQLFVIRNSHGSVVSLTYNHLSGHQGPVTALVVSSDYSHLYSGSADQSIIIWDLSKHQQVGRLTGHKGAITVLLLSPKCNYDCDMMLFSACNEGYVKVWDTVIGSEVSAEKCHNAPIVALAVAGKGNRQLLCTGDATGLLKLWDPVSLALLGSHKIHSTTVTALAASATRIYSANNTLKVWTSISKDGSRGGESGSFSLTLLYKVKVHSRLITAMTLHADRLYTGSKAVKVWDATTLRLLGSMKKHSHYVTDIAVSANQQRLYSSSHVIKVWDLGCTAADMKAIKILREHGLSTKVSCLAASGDYLYSGSSNIHDIYYRAIDTSAYLSQNQSQALVSVRPSASAEADSHAHTEYTVLEAARQSDQDPHPHLLHTTQSAYSSFDEGQSNSSSDNDNGHILDSRERYISVEYVQVHCSTRAVL